MKEECSWQWSMFGSYRPEKEYNVRINTVERYYGVKKLPLAVVLRTGREGAKDIQLGISWVWHRRRQLSTRLNAWGVGKSHQRAEVVAGHAVGINWLTSFLNRHSTLSTHYTDQISQKKTISSTLEINHGHLKGTIFSFIPVGPDRETPTERFPIATGQVYQYYLYQRWKVAGINSDWDFFRWGIIQTFGIN